MSSGLGRGRELDVGSVGIESSSLAPLPDAASERPESAWLDVRGWFAEPSRPFEIEIGSGKGTFLLQQAERSPDVNYLGIEWAKEYWAYAADRLRRRGMTNVKMLHGDATEFVRWRVPSGIVRVVHLYFSDPWPKSRHHKRRVVQDRFLGDVARILVDRGELRIVTDHADYWQWMEEHFARWAPADGSGVYTRHEFERPESAGSGEVVGTNFERKYAREGRPFFATALQKR